MEVINYYTYSVVWSDDDNEYIGLCREFPSISAFGETHEQALANIKEEIAYILSWMEEEGEQIPLPVKDIDYSGRLLLRLPKRLHKELAQQAKLNDVSINQFIMNVLSENLYSSQMSNCIGQIRETAAEIKMVSDGIKKT